MHILRFLIFDKQSGLPIYSHEYDEAKNENSEVLLTGMLAAIQNLMRELNLGELNSIDTEKYQITGYQGFNYTFILIGKETPKDLIVTLLQDYAIKFEEFSIGITGLTPNQKFIVEQMAATLKRTIDKAAFFLHIYKYTQEFGIEILHADDNSLISAHIINYIRSIKKKDRKKDQLFYDFLCDESLVWGAMTTNNNTTYILALNLSNTELSSIIGFRHHFAGVVRELITNDLETITDALGNPTEVQEILMWYQEKLTRALEEYRFTYGLAQIENIVYILQPILPQILSTIITGTPLAIIADENSVSYIIDFLVYVTNMGSAKLSFSNEEPARLVRYEAAKHAEYEMLNYAFLDLENLSITPAKEFAYFKSIIVKQSTVENITEKLEIIRKAYSGIYNNLDVILKYQAKGADVNLILENVEQEEREVIIAVINWINPYILTKKITELKAINW